MINIYMSEEYDKFKHSRRRQQKENYVHRQADILKAYHLEPKNGQEHRYAKHSSMNCGNPKCILCSNPRKIFNEKTIQEQRHEQSKLWDEE